MQKERSGKTIFRQRGFLCSNCQSTTMQFGAGDDAAECPTCNQIGKLAKEWDNIVTQQVTIDPVLPV